MSCKQGVRTCISRVGNTLTWPCFVLPTTPVKASVLVSVQLIFVVTLSLTSNIAPFQSSIGLDKATLVLEQASRGNDLDDLTILDDIIEEEL